MFRPARKAAAYGLAAIGFAVALAACGGGGGGGGNGGNGMPPGGGSTPTPVATFPATLTQTITLGASPQTATFTQIASGASGSVNFPATTSGAGSASITLQSTLPTGAPIPQSANVRRPASLGAVVTPLAYFIVNPANAVTFGASPGFTFSFPVGTLQGYAYIAFFDPTHPALGWNAIAGPLPTSGTALIIPSQNLTSTISLAAGTGSIFAIVENGAPLPTPTPSPTSTPAPAAQQVTMSAAQPVAMTATLGAVTTAITFPSLLTDSTVTATVTASLGAPSGFPIPSRVSSKMHRWNLGASVTPLVYLSVAPSGVVDWDQTPAMRLTEPPGVLQGDVYLAEYFGTPYGWIALTPPVSPSSTSVALPSFIESVTLASGAATVFAIVQNGAPLPTPTPYATPTPIAAGGTGLTGFTDKNGIGWGPPGIAYAFDYPVDNGYNGAGTSIGIIITACPNPGDLSAFWSYFQITPTPSVTCTPIDGGSSAAPSSEETLDSETISGLAPGASVKVYVVPGLTDQDVNDALAKAVSDRMWAVSMSLGQCEANANGYADTNIIAAANQGTAVVASSGDQGNECFNGPGSYIPGVSYPASNPLVVAVGGTESDYNNPTTVAQAVQQMTTPAAWNDTLCSAGQCAGGGGVSHVYAIPPWQQAVNTTMNGGSATMRNVPDIGMPAVEAAIDLHGAWQSELGTSWSAPQTAALIAELDEYCNTTFAYWNDWLDYAYELKNSAFIDVTQGNNQFAGATPYYSAGPGFDNVSGVGMPLGMPIANTICPNRQPLGLARARAQGQETAQRLMVRHSQASRSIATPMIRGLTSAVRRSAMQETRIQVVLAQPSVADETAVVQALRSAGFTIVKTYPIHTLVDAQAPAATIERYFETNISNVIEGRYGQRYTNLRPLTIPSGIAPYVRTIITNNLVTMSTQ